MAPQKTSRKVEGVNLVHLRHDEAKGRYLTASREIRIGAMVFEEQAFSGILVANNDADAQYCCNCFKTIHQQPVKCLGCLKSLYCSLDCKITAWKSHHWVECFLREVLERLLPDVRLSLRTLLNAAHSIYGENSTDSVSVSKLITRFTEQVADADIKAPYSSNYWSVFCLQTHENEPKREKEIAALCIEAKIVARILLDCFSLYGNIVKTEAAAASTNSTRKGKKGRNQTEVLVRNLFKRMAFSSYYSSEYFDIEMWKFFVEDCCQLFDFSSISPIDHIAVREVITGEVSTEKDLLEKLLVHHAMQVRTNSQAVFKISESSGQSQMQIVEQMRIATCFFPITSLMNHSCSPNVAVAFDGRNIMVVATKRILKGEEICHCYGPHFTRHGVDDRQNKLLKQYFFACHCDACQTELIDQEQVSFRLQFYAFKCRYCGEPLKQDKLQDDSPNGVKTGTCINEECKKQLDLRWNIIGFDKVEVSYIEATKLINGGMIKKAITKFQDCLKLAEDVLYHNHMAIAKVNDKLAQCYAMLEDYTSAVTHLGKSISIVGMLHGPNSVEVAHELQKLSSLYFNLRNPLQSCKIAQKVLAIYKTHYRQEHLFPPGADEMRKVVNLCRKMR